MKTDYSQWHWDCLLREITALGEDMGDEVVSGKVSYMRSCGAGLKACDWCRSDTRILIRMLGKVRSEKASALSAELKVRLEGAGKALSGA